MNGTGGPGPSKQSNGDGGRRGGPNRGGRGGWRGRRTCFTCGQEGHMARGCPSGGGGDGGADNSRQYVGNGRVQQRNQYHYRQEQPPMPRIVNITDPRQVVLPPSQLYPHLDYNQMRREEYEAEAAAARAAANAARASEDPVRYVYSDQVPPDPSFEFEAPATDQHLRARIDRQKFQKERRLVKGISDKYEMDCRGLHSPEDICQFCDGRRGEWTQDERPKDEAKFDSYQNSFVESWPEQEDVESDNNEDDADADEKKEEGAGESDGNGVTLDEKKEEGAGESDSNGVTPNENSAEKTEKNEEPAEEEAVADDNHLELAKACEKITLQEKK